MIYAIMMEIRRISDRRASAGSRPNSEERYHLLRLCADRPLQRAVIAQHAARNMRRFQMLDLTP